MESPPSYSTQSEAPPLSDDSGLLVTSGSFSSDSASGWPQISLELQESDYDEKSLSLCETAEASERMCGGHFNTVKKGPGKITVTAIEPPPQFQDSPPVVKQKIKKQCTLVEHDDIPPDIILKVERVTLEVCLPERQTAPVYANKLKCEASYERRQCLNQRFASPRLLPLSPCRGARPASRSSLSSRLSSSHNSLVTQLPADDSNYITQAISHHTLSANNSHILDMYTVPFDSDIYAVPIDMVHPVHTSRHKSKKPQKSHRKRGKSISQATVSNCNIAPERTPKIPKETRSVSEGQESTSKRHSLPGPSMNNNPADVISEPMHMTLREVRKYLHTLYSSSSESDSRNNIPISCNNHFLHTSSKETSSRATENCNAACQTIESNNNLRKIKSNTFVNNIKIRKHKHNKQEVMDDAKIKKTEPKQIKPKSSPVKILSLNLKQTFCNLFRLKRSSAPSEVVLTSDGEEAAGAAAGAAAAGGGGDCAGPVVPVPRRALPPLPHPPNPTRRLNEDEAITDFATSIQKVKDYGWYWGPISVEGAEKILSNEPDGSFIVRDSSDHHYIFTLTFKLNGLRHVRIEHEQGNFCFGGCTMFKAATIVEFIENAVETSRSGRYLFFLNLRPVLGPVRVQLLYPVSRFKRVQSLQHMCRFVILKVVRRDLIESLPLPRRMLDYLSATHYFSELLADS